MAKNTDSTHTDLSKAKADAERAAVENLRPKSCRKSGHIPACRMAKYGASDTEYRSAKTLGRSISTG